MRPLLAPIFALVSAFALVSSPASAEAATGVARCAMPDGTFAYTNIACSRLGGHHVALPADVQNRIRREQRREAKLTGASTLPEGLLAAPYPREPRRPKGQGCATSPRQLAVYLRASMAQGDVNRIAESFDWVDMSHGRAMQMMTRLRRLGGVLLVDAEFFGSAPAGAPSVAGDGTLQVVLEEAGAHKVADFDVRRHGGCYFLQHRWAV